MIKALERGDSAGNENSLCSAAAAAAADPAKLSSASMKLMAITFTLSIISQNI